MKTNFAKLRRCVSWVKLWANNSSNIGVVSTLGLPQWELIVDLTFRKRCKIEEKEN